MMYVQGIMLLVSAFENLCPVYAYVSGDFTAVLTHGL